MRPDPDLLQQWVNREGLPAGQVGQRLGLSRAAGYAWLHRYGITGSGPVVAQRQLIARWRDGLLVAQVAAELGLPPDAVRERLVTASVLTPVRSYFMVGSPDDPLLEHLLREWCGREGFTVAQVAALTGTTPRQVRYRLARYRLSAARPGPAASVRLRLTRATLIELYRRDGLSCAEIAARARVSPETVRELLTEYGVPLRRTATPRPGSAAPRRPTAAIH